MIRIQKDQLEEIIHDRLMPLLDSDALIEVLTLIMEDVEKNDAFKPWRR